MLKSSRARRAGMSTLLICCAALTLTGCFLLPNRHPVASFVVHYNVDEEDSLVVYLVAADSSDPDDDRITSYMWTFGDDVNIVNPLTYSKMMAVPVIQVRYPSEGAYTVELVVIDERGAASSPVTQQIILPNIPVGPTL